MPIRCVRPHSVGESLHAFEDTFGHRSKDNTPISVNAGMGHAVYGEEPDKTYNNTVWASPYPSAIGTWDLQEMRTLEMEKEVYKKMTTLARDGAKLTWDQIGIQLETYNATHEEGNASTQKFALLNKILKSVVARPDGDVMNFSVGGSEHYQPKSSEQKNNREKFLCDKEIHRLRQEEYKGTILPGQDVPCMAKK